MHDACREPQGTWTARARAGHITFPFASFVIYEYCLFGHDVRVTLYSCYEILSRLHQRRKAVHRRDLII